MTLLLLFLVGCDDAAPPAVAPAAPPVAPPAATPTSPPPLTPDSSGEPETRWELDAPGGGGGAPLGADFFIGPDVVGATTFVGEVGGAVGFSLALTRPSNAVACTVPFPVAPKMKGRGRVRVRSVQPGPGPYQGFTAEVRNYDPKGVLVPGPGSQYIPLQVWREPADWVEFDTAFTPPDHTTNAKICLRFVDATGEVDVDWLGVAGVSAGAVVAEGTEGR